MATISPLRVDLPGGEIVMDDTVIFEGFFLMELTKSVGFVICALELNIKIKE
jgi:hypothetical protein